MSRLQIALPSPARVHEALRTTTERLAGELMAPAQTAPDWSELEWCIARAASAIHGVSGLLAGRLVWQGPTDWQDFLTQQRGHMVRRQAHLEHLLRVVDEAMRGRGIAGIALKGTALYAAGIYSPGERPMADLDVLVRPADFERCTALLETLGFQERYRFWKNRVFSPRDEPPPGRLGEDSNNAIRVELHDRICEILPLRLTDISHFIQPAEATPGLGPYPSKAALMAHLLLHAAGGIVPREVRLIQLHDIARLAARMSDQDWIGVLRVSDRPRGPWWALPPLALTVRHCGPVIPQWVIAAAAACCPAVLRAISRRQRLSDVSLSRVWVDALPGITWARSVHEALAYTVGRIAPTAARKSDLKLAAALQPSLVEGGWYHLSQTRRILRWLTSRQTRSLTMDVVRAAATTRAD
jgi:putative nucleotidyltransferase-like protein